MSRVVGIDLGTTNSCVAVLEGDQPTVIPNSEGGRTTPSIVAITKNGERLVGEAARRQMTVNVDRTITSIKRAMGTTYRKRIDGKDYSPQEISAIILAKLKSDAESYLGGPVSDAVITVPAYFDDSQRQATKDAGRIAGLNVLRIINEPTSAALAYGLDNGQAQKILVYDLGGGTFDVSVIEIGDSVIEVLATAGDNHLGGDDFDERLLDHVIKTFKKETKVNLAKDITASQRVREACENAKKELSFAQTAHINLPFISTVKNQPVHLDMTITREQFNELTYDLTAPYNLIAGERYRLQTEFRYEEGTEYSEPMANWVEFEVKMNLPYKEAQPSTPITIPELQVNAMSGAMGETDEITASPCAYYWQAPEPNEDGTMSSIIGCGYEIGEESSLPEITAVRAGLISHRKSNEIWLYFEVQPDTVRIQCVPQNGGEVETITGILPYDGGYAFDLKSGSFVYRVIAEWDDGNRVEYGFIGKWL